MASLIIVHDTQREIATFVDADTQQGYGPALIGPDAGDDLQAFVDAMPFDVGALTPEQLTAVFQDFAQRLAGDTPEAPATAPAPALEQIGDTGVDPGVKLADATAGAATDVPAPQPADTDPEAAPAAPVTIINCHACQGAGTLDLGDGQGPVTCNMCQGTGQIAVRA